MALQLLRQQTQNINKQVQMNNQSDEDMNSNLQENFSYSIHINLLSKYDEVFNYIYASPIKALIYNRQRYPINIMYKDVAAYSEEIQYLRREYHLVAQSGKKQIYDRLRLLGDFYGRALVMKYQYPMMLLTRNEDTFKRKLRRMKKMIAADASSDDSDEGSINYDSFSTIGFLNNLNKIQSGQQSESSSYEYRRVSYDSSIHDVYENTDMVFSFMERNTLENVKEVDVSHLICDVRDVDYEKTIQSYGIIQEKQRDSKYKDFSHLNKILKKQASPEGTIIVQKPQKNKIETASFEPREDIKGKLIYHDREGKKEKKQKIRDKAAALLNRVKSREYVDYSKYLSENTQVQWPEEGQLQ